jgi:hypothetical protein
MAVTSRGAHPFYPPGQIGAIGAPAVRSGRTTMSAQLANATDAELAGQQPKISDLNVWLLISMPFIGPLFERLSGITLSVWVYVLANTVLILLDAGRIARSGRTGAKLARWIWITPVYLFRRARALGDSQRYFGAWFVAFLAGIIATGDLTGAWNSYWGYGAPACDGGYARVRIKSLFDTIPVMRNAEIHATQLHPQGETSFAGDTRNCRGVIDGSDGKNHPVTYTFQWTKDWEVRSTMRLAD